jgi:hypothetical protein
VEPRVLEPVPGDARREPAHARAAAARLGQRVGERGDTGPRHVVVDLRIAERDERDALARALERDELGHRGDSSYAAA